MVCPGYWRWAAPEMAFAVEDFDPKVVVWQDEEIGGTVAKARAELGSDHRALWLRHDTGGAGSYEAFLASGAAEDPDSDVDPDSALLVIYTAAITGRQSGSMLSQRNLLAMGASTAWMGDIGHETAFLSAGPMFHIGNYQFWGIAGLRARRQERDRAPRRRRGTPAPARRRAVHARLPDAPDHRPARRPQPRGRTRPVPAAGDRRRPGLGGHGAHRPEPLHPQRRRRRAAATARPR